MKNIFLFSLILAGVAWRVSSALDPALVNFAPVTALAFCGAVFLRDWRGWLAAIAVLTLSDLWLNHYYATQLGYTWDSAQMLLRLVSLGVAFGLGLLVACRITWVTLLGGAVLASLAFYFVTNTAAWATDPFYAKTAAGWWQAMTVGHPEWPPPVLFLRNSLMGDLAFTGCLALVAHLYHRTAPGPNPTPSPSFLRRSSQTAALHSRCQ